MLSRVALPKAPPISGEQWLNSAPLTHRELRGRPTVLLFWAASCEASWVRLRQLERLRSRHGDQLAVVAVHSPRFDYERNVEVVSSLIEQRGLRVPVVHDPDLETWARYGPTGRPAVVVLDKNQRVLGAMFGTDPSSMESLDQMVATETQLAAPDLPPLPDLLTSERTGGLRTLQAPSAVARLADGRLAIADRGNDRLVVADLNPSADLDGFTASVTDVFGGLHGLHSIAVRTDGTIAVSFPDRGVVESIDPRTKARASIVDDLVRPMGLVEDVDQSLVICDPGADTVVRVSADATGPITTHASQPLDIVRISSGLVFAESATGSLRHLADKGKLRTINTGDQPGLRDGRAHKAMFQRIAGLASLDCDRVAIADHGNDRIRILADRSVTTVPLSGLSRPEGLLYLGAEQLLCCDTGHDRMVVIDLAAHSATELVVDQLPV